MKSFGIQQFEIVLSRLLMSLFSDSVIKLDLLVPLIYFLMFKGGQKNKWCHDWKVVKHGKAVCLLNNSWSRCQSFAIWTSCNTILNISWRNHQNKMIAYKHHFLDWIWSFSTQIRFVLIFRTSNLFTCCQLQLIIYKLAGFFLLQCSWAEKILWQLSRSC